MGKDNEDYIAANQPPDTAPKQYQISLRGFANEDRAKNIGHLIGLYIRELSRYIDLGGLDGVTVAFDYEEALFELDRGYETSYRLTPSNEHAIGIAMTPSVIRNGKIKSHIVISAGVAELLGAPEGENFRLALHALAHECAHVEVTNRFDTAFPGFLLKKPHDNMLDNLRWQVILACWDEYAASWISASIGEDCTKDYEETFLQALEKTRPKANQLIKAYRIQGDVDQVLAEVFGAYGNLMKFACYQLGNMRGRKLTLDDLPVTKSTLDAHWFESHFHSLKQLCGDIADSYGKWTKLEPFEAIGALAEAIVTENGVVVTRCAGEDLYVDIPFSPETMPD